MFNLLEKIVKVILAAIIAAGKKLLTTALKLMAVWFWYPSDSSELHRRSYFFQMVNHLYKNTLINGSPFPAVKQYLD